MAYTCILNTKEMKKKMREKCEIPVEKQRNKRVVKACRVVVYFARLLYAISEPLLAVSLCCSHITSILFSQDTFDGCLFVSSRRLPAIVHSHLSISVWRISTTRICSERNKKTGDGKYTFYSITRAMN